MIHALGFLGLSLNLTSMAMKDIFQLRLFSLIANAIYIVYGLLIDAAPIVVGSTIAVLIHSINIYKLKRPSQAR